MYETENKWKGLVYWSRLYHEQRIQFVVHSTKTFNTASITGVIAPIPASTTHFAHKPALLLLVPPDRSHVDHVSSPNCPVSARSVPRSVVSVRQDSYHHFSLN